MQRLRVDASRIRTRKRSKERPSKEGKLQNRPTLLYWVTADLSELSFRTYIELLVRVLE